MESTNLEMDDLFDQHGGDLEDGFDQHQTTTAMMDGEAEEGPMRASGGEDGPSEDVLAKLKDLKGAGKKRVMKPQPKLDAERIRGDRGLATLPKLFENVKFKGKGHEADDLKKMMQGLEHWAHRLYPKATFDEFVERLEKLGSKREVQTYVKRIRMDMLEELAPGGDDEDDNAAPLHFGADEGEEDPFGNPIGHKAQMDDMDAEEAYDAMIQAEREKMASSQSQQPPTPAAEATPVKPTPPTPSTNNTGMTPELKARMEANKLKALQKRAARLGVSVESLMPAKPAPTSDVPSDASQAAKKADALDESKTDYTAVESESLNLRMSETQENSGGKTGSCEEEAMETESMQLRLTESESKTESESMNLRLSESEEKGKTGSESMNLRLSESEEKSESIKLKLTESEDKGESKAESNDLRLSDSEDNMDTGKAESMNLRMSETPGSNSVNASLNTESVNVFETESNKENSSLTINTEVAINHKEPSLKMMDSDQLNNSTVDENLNATPSKKRIESDSSLKLHLGETETVEEAQRKVSNTSDQAEESFVLQLSDTNISQSEEEEEQAREITSALAT